MRFTIHNIITLKASLETKQYALNLLSKIKSLYNIKAIRIQVFLYKKKIDKH